MIWEGDDTPLRSLGISLVLPERASSRVNPLLHRSLQALEHVWDPWERVYPRKGRQPYEDSEPGA